MWIISCSLQLLTMAAVKAPKLHRLDITGKCRIACTLAMDSLVFLGQIRELTLEHWEVQFADVTRIQSLSGLRSLEVGTLELEIHPFHCHEAQGRQIKSQVCGESLTLPTSSSRGVRVLQNLNEE
jgi:hypothetical protein